MRKAKRRCGQGCGTLAAVEETLHVPAVVQEEEKLVATSAIADRRACASTTDSRWDFRGGIDPDEASATTDCRYAGASGVGRDSGGGQIGPT